MKNIDTFLDANKIGILVLELGEVNPFKSSLEALRGCPGGKDCYWKMIKET